MKVIAHGPTEYTGYGHQPTLHVSLTLIEFNLLVHGLRSYTELGARNVTSAQNGCDDRTMAATPANCPHAQAPDPRPEIGMEFTLKAEHLSDTLDALNHATRILRTFTVLAPPAKAEPEPVDAEFVTNDPQAEAIEAKRLAKWATNRVRWVSKPLSGLPKGSDKHKAVLAAIRKNAAKKAARTRKGY